MLAIVLGPLLLSTAPTASEAPQAETFAAAGEAHLRRATEEHSPDEFEAAHKNFDSAYLVADDPRYLCRALAVAELALRSATFATQQERLSWEDLRREDLDRLRDDAAQAQRSNCRFDVSGKPLPPRVALIDPDGPAPAAARAPVAGASANAPPVVVADVRRSASGSAVRAQSRRARAHTVTGAIFTSVGLGLLGGLAGVIGLEVQRAGELKGLIRTAKAEGRDFTEPEDRRADELGTELLRGRDVAIGVGAASLVSLTTGIVVLATGRNLRTPKYAVQPYGGPQGAGAVLRLRF